VRPRRVLHAFQTRSDVTLELSCTVLFNFSKCKILHLGKPSYTMAGYVLEEVSEEKDLGVVIDGNLKFHSHSAAVLSKANRLLGLIKHYLSNNTFTKLYKSIVRPSVKYGNLIWGPFFIADCNKIENNHQKATRMVSNIRNFEYQDRVKVLKLPSLKISKI